MPGLNRRKKGKLSQLLIYRLLLLYAGWSASNTKKWRRRHLGKEVACEKITSVLQNILHMLSMEQIPIFPLKKSEVDSSEKGSHLSTEHGLGKCLLQNKDSGLSVHFLRFLFLCYFYETFFLHFLYCIHKILGLISFKSDELQMNLRAISISDDSDDFLSSF